MVAGAGRDRGDREYAHTCVFLRVFTREHIRSINCHDRGRAAGDIHRAIRARAHPIYAGAELLTFALGSLWGLLAAAIATPVLIARILDEERMLSKELPGYDDYRRAVPYRLISLAWYGRREWRASAQVRHRVGTARRQASAMRSKPPRKFVLIKF
jgi:hypothetical protein